MVDVTKENGIEAREASALERAEMPRLRRAIIVWRVAINGPPYRLSGPEARLASAIAHLLPAPPIAKMSDYEDEMDVDAPPVKESIVFSSDNTNAKGKRSAANLPVEAEDNLPW